MDYYIDRIIDSMKIKAVIFDLDGTLIDNNAYHLLAWKQYLKNIGREISEEEYKKHINGRTNKDAIEYIFGRRMDDAEAMHYALEKEAIYREMYSPFIKPVDGLIALLEALDQRHVPMAIATSGIQVNIDFMFDHIPIRQYFKTIVNSVHIKKGKPDAEIYIKTASQLDVPPQQCLVFEDAIVGIQSAQAAAMRVVAISTTHTSEELSKADIVLPDFTPLLQQEIITNK